MNGIPVPKESFPIFYVRKDIIKEIQTEEGLEQLCWDYGFFTDDGDTPKALTTEQIDEVMHSRIDSLLEEGWELNEENDTLERAY